MSRSHPVVGATYRLTPGVTAYAGYSEANRAPTPLELGNTLRQGVEAGTTLNWDKWSAYANYCFVDATFQSPLVLSSPNNPVADPDGCIFVVVTVFCSIAPRPGAEYTIT